MSPKPAATAASSSKRRGRKSHYDTYAHRKEEKQQLLNQIRTLEAQMALVTSNMPLTNPALCSDIASVASNAVVLSKDEEELRTQAERNAHARELLRVQQLSLWGAHSMLSDWLNDQSVNPLSISIRLTRDPQQRREALTSVKQCVLADAQQFLSTRTHFLDVLKPYYIEDRCENARGDYCATRFDIVQFEDVESVQQVFDALVAYMVFMEISISEKIGDVTVREDFDVQDSSVVHNRLLSTNRFGVTTEMNRVVFAHFQHGETHAEQDHAIFMCDFVDEDELRPYSPSSCLRKDLTGAVSLTAHRRKSSVGQSEDEELVVVMCRAAFVKLHHPEMSMAKHLLREAQENISHWGGVMIQAMRDQLYHQCGESPGSRVNTVSNEV